MRKTVLTCLLTLLLGSVSAFATVVPVDGSWHEFLFDLAGTFATSCGGAGCVPTVDPVAEEVSSPPWTFSGAATVTMTDMFQRGDRFELFDNAVSVGLTSVPVNDGAGTCNNDILVCLADKTYSHASFILGAGAHSLTIKVNQNALGTSGGAAAFAVGAAVPEPRAYAALLMIGLFGLGALRRKLG